MENDLAINEFEKFPFAELTPQISRKQFFKSIRKELTLYVNNSARRKISDLGLMEEKELSLLIPKILPEVKIILDNNYIWGLHSDAASPQKLFKIDKLSIQTFNKINGHKPIGRITNEISTSFDLDHSRAFLYVRGLFLTLVQAKVCLPINIPKQEDCK